MSTLTLREQIISAIMEALTPITKQEGVLLFRSPTQPITPARCPALLLFPETDTVVGRSNDRVDRELTIRFVALVHEQGKQSPHLQADQLLAVTHITLWSDRKLPTLVLQISEQECEWEFEEGDGIAAAVSARYSFHYRTMINNLCQRG